VVDELRDARAQGRPGGLDELEGRKPPLGCGAHQLELERDEDSLLNSRQHVGVILDELEKLVGEDSLCIPPGDHNEGRGSSVADTDCEVGSTDRLDRGRRCLLGCKGAQLSSGVTTWPMVGRSKELSRLS